MDRAVRREGERDALVALHADRRRLEIRAARALRVIDESFHYVYEGCASLGEFGERYGSSARETRMLAAVGRALALRPELEEEIVAGRLTLDAAAALGKIFEDPSLLREGDDWLSWAEEWTAKRLEREVRKRMKEVREQEPTSVLTAILTATGREKFERARGVACRKQNKLLDEGQTIEVLSDYYLDGNDPARVAPGTRRVPDTKGRRGRYVPAAVKREILARSEGTCEFPGCDHEIWQELCHDEPHRSGGSREADNLRSLCARHHGYYDAGLIRREQTPDGPVWVIRDQRRAPPRSLGTGGGGNGNGKGAGGGGGQRDPPAR